MKDKEQKANIMKKLEAAFLKKAYTLDDAEERRQWILENYARTDDRIKHFNEMLKMAWLAPIRKFDDKQFVEKLLAPLANIYGSGILSLEGLEEGTGRRRTS